MAPARQGSLPSRIPPGVSTSSPPDPLQLGSAGAGANSIYRPGPARPARMRRRLTPRTAPSPPPPARPPSSPARAAPCPQCARAAGRAPSGRRAALPAPAPPPRPALHLRAPASLLPVLVSPHRLPHAVQLTPSLPRWRWDLGVSDGRSARPGRGGARPRPGLGEPGSSPRPGAREPRARPSGRSEAAAEGPANGERGRRRSRPMASEDGGTTWSGRRM